MIPITDFEQHARKFLEPYQSECLTSLFLPVRSTGGESPVQACFRQAQTQPPPPSLLVSQLGTDAEFSPIGHAARLLLSTLRMGMGTLDPASWSCFRVNLLLQAWPSACSWPRKCGTASRLRTRRSIPTCCATTSPSSWPCCASTHGHRQVKHPPSRCSERQLACCCSLDATAYILVMRVEPPALCVTCTLYVSLCMGVQTVDNPEHKLRNVVLEVLNRLPHNEVLRPYVPELLRLALQVLGSDNEDNAIIALRIIFDLHKNFRPHLEQQVQPFLDFVRKVCDHPQTNRRPAPIAEELSHRFVSPSVLA